VHDAFTLSSAFFILTVMFVNGTTSGV